MLRLFVFRFRRGDDRRQLAVRRRRCQQLFAERHASVPLPPRRQRPGGAHLPAGLARHHCQRGAYGRHPQQAAAQKVRPIATAVVTSTTTSITDTSQISCKGALRQDPFYLFTIHLQKFQKDQHRIQEPFIFIL